jgi:dTMP kinase
VDHSQDGPPVGLNVERLAYRELLRNRSFRNLFFAGLTSSLGDWIGVLAILALTKSILGPTRAAAFALSGVMIARVLPTLLLGPVAGVFVDRWDRRRLMITTDIGRGIVMAIVPFAQDVWALFLATLLIEVMTTLFIPTKDAVVPNLVRRDQLVQANQLNLGVGYGTLPLGGALFALLVGASTTLFTGVEFLQRRPASLAIWVNAVSFFLSAIFIARIPGLHGRTRRAQKTESLGAWAELKGGFAFIVNQPLVRALVVGIMGAFLAAGAVVAVGELFVDVVNAGSTGFGVLVATVGVGLAAGLIASGPLSKRVAKERFFGPAIAVAGGGLIGAAFMPRLDLAMIPAFVMGVGGGLAFVAGYTLLQEHTSDAVRGRTFAAFNTGVRASLFAALVAAPFLVGVLGVEPGSDLAGNPVYVIGGVRITLMAAGAVALVGAAYTAWSIRKVLGAPSRLHLGAGEVMHRGPGMFVVFEGGEGAGKSTQVRLLRSAIERSGHDAVVTREPGGTAIGERIRHVLLDPENDAMSDRAEALLYSAARAQHVDEVIRPALEKGQVVLCDRFVDSSIVYQGVARGLGDNEIAELNRWATADLQPDLVIVLDIDPVEGLRRAGSPDRLEMAGFEFHSRVNQAFRHRASMEPDRYLLLDGNDAAETLHATIREAVFSRLRSWE